MNGTTIVSVRLESVRFTGYHGVFNQEAFVGNEFVVDMEVRYPSDLKTIMNDELANTISYADLYAIVKEQMAERSALLETVAARILACTQARWPHIIDAQVRIRKVSVPIAGIDGSASVTLKLTHGEDPQASWLSHINP